MMGPAFAGRRPSGVPSYGESPLAGQPGGPLARPLRVAAFTGGVSVPSARFRVRQYVAALRPLGIRLREFPAPLGSYPPADRRLRLLWAPATLASRLPAVVGSYQYDLTLLQREMLSTFVTVEPWTHAPRVLDVDDAIFVLRGGGFAARLARSCELAICGNAFLAEQFGQWAPRVAVLPTGIDVRRYVPPPPVEPQRPVIGWIGSSANFRYLYAIQNVLARVLRECPGTVLRVVAERPPRLRALPRERLEFIPWSARTEVDCVQGMQVGIMPLADSPWERGKCSFKLLQYMACGVPFVASPVGMNAEVLALGDAGLPAEDERQWRDALGGLLAERIARQRMGQAGRAIVERHFSTDVLAPRLAALLQGVAAGRGD
jgi:glycosyltransferase involved in cell wall biosynthesis